MQRQPFVSLKPICCFADRPFSIQMGLYPKPVVSQTPLLSLNNNSPNHSPQNMKIFFLKKSPPKTHCGPPTTQDLGNNSPQKPRTNFQWLFETSRGEPNNDELRVKGSETSIQFPPRSDPYPSKIFKLKENKIK